MLNGPCAYACARAGACDGNFYFHIYHFWIDWNKYICYAFFFLFDFLGSWFRSLCGPPSEYRPSVTDPSPWAVDFTGAVAPERDRNHVHVFEGLSFWDSPFGGRAPGGGRECANSAGRPFLPTPPRVRVPAVRNWGHTVGPTVIPCRIRPQMRPSSWQGVLAGLVSHPRTNQGKPCLASERLTTLPTEPALPQHFVMLN